MTPALRRARAALSLVAVVAIACGASWDRTTSPLAPPSAPARSLSALTPVTNRANTGLCADVTNAVFANGTAVRLFTCASGASQKWAATSSGEYRANGTAYCLDTVNGLSADGTKVMIWDCYGAPSQQWAWTAAGELKGIGGKCVEPLASSVKKNVALAIYTCANKTSQKWNAPAAPIDSVPPPPPPPSDTNTYIDILPSQSIQAVVDANPAGTKFKLKAGTHIRQDVKPKAGSLFQGEAGTILDGQNVSTFAFRGYNGAAWVNSVTLKNLTITNYMPPAQNGAIWGGDDQTNSTSGWTLDSVTVSYSSNIGVRIGNRMKVLRSNLHHNGTMGIGGIGLAVLVDSTESAYNNNGCVNNPGNESGGSKFVLTDSLIVRNSFWHHNCGVGLWLDISNIHALLENNRVEDNVREGICVEISFATVIRNNSVSRNGWPADPYRANGWLWDAGIGIHASSDVEVYGNTLDENFNGIAGIQQPRDVAHGDAYAPAGGYLLQNLYVHDNTIYQRTLAPGGDGSASGAVNDAGDLATFQSRNNRWVHNTYYLGTTNLRPFAWMNGYRTPAEWRAYGQDVTGVFNP